MADLETDDTPLPKLPSRLGKESRRKKIDGQPLNYIVEDEVVFEAVSHRGKAFCVQKLRFDDGHEEFRVCYYMIAQRPRMKGKWAFGQFAPMMTRDEFQTIIEKVTEKGWLL